MSTSKVIIVIVALVIGIPFNFFGEEVRELGLSFFRYNDLVIVGNLLLITAAALIYSMVAPKAS